MNVVSGTSTVEMTAPVSALNTCSRPSRVEPQTCSTPCMHVVNTIPHRERLRCGVEVATIHYLALVHSDASERDVQSVVLVDSLLVTLVCRARSSTPGRRCLRVLAEPQQRFSFAQEVADLRQWRLGGLWNLAFLFELIQRRKALHCCGSLRVSRAIACTGPTSFLASGRGLLDGRRGNLLRVAWLAGSRCLHPCR